MSIAKILSGYAHQNLTKRVFQCSVQELQRTRLRGRFPGILRISPPSRCVPFQGLSHPCLPSGAAGFPALQYIRGDSQTDRNLRVWRFRSPARFEHLRRGLCTERTASAARLFHLFESSRLNRTI
jgi:hypothetical protein